MTIMASSEIGQFLKSLREEKGEGKGHWSLRAVAERAAISDSYLSQLETGQAENPTPHVLRQLAEALRHPYLDLMKRAGYLPDEESEEIRILQRLSKEAIEALSDPVALKALLTTHKANKQVKEQVESVLEQLSNMDPGKIAAVARLLSA